MEQPAIELSGIRKAFGRRHPVAALKDVTVSIPEGAIVALLGGNGAGKSTLLRIMTGTVRSDAGRVAVLGRELPVGIEGVRHRIGVLPAGGAGLYDRLSSREQLRYLGGLRGLSGRLVEERIAELTVQLGLETFVDRRCGTLSTGMRQRTALAGALLHNPDLVIMDEPTTGLDLGARKETGAMINDLARRGATIVVATHHPDEMADSVTHLVYLSAGEIAASEEVSGADLPGRAEELMESTR